MISRTLIAVLAVAAGTGLVACATAPRQPACPPQPVVSMNLQRLQQVLHSSAKEVQGGGGQWRFTSHEVQMALLTSVEHDRMRIISPIVKESRLTQEHRRRMLEANFHTALDARYATSHGTVYATYIHPLSLLTPEELRSAMSQVAQLVNTFGTTYSSGALEFSAPGAPTQEPASQDT